MNSVALSNKRYNCGHIKSLVKSGRKTKNHVFSVVISIFKADKVAKSLSKSAVAVFDAM